MEALLHQSQPQNFSILPTLRRMKNFAPAAFLSCMSEVAESDEASGPVVQPLTHEQAFRGYCHHPGPDESSGPVGTEDPSTSEDLLGSASGAAGAAGRADGDDDDYLPPPPAGPIPKSTLEAAGMDVSNLQLIILILMIL